MIPGTNELDAFISIFATVENLELTPELREGLTAKTLVRFASRDTAHQELLCPTDSQFKNVRP